MLNNFEGNIPKNFQMIYFFTVMNFILWLQKDPSKSDLIDKFNNTYCYLDDIVSVINSDCDKYTGKIYQKKLKLNKANNNNFKCPFLDLDVYISQGKIITKIYDKRGDFSFPIVHMPFLDVDVSLFPSYGVYISQLNRFAHEV